MGWDRRVCLPEVPASYSLPCCPGNVSLSQCSLATDYVLPWTFLPCAPCSVNCLPPYGLSRYTSRPGCRARWAARGHSSLDFASVGGAGCAGASDSAD